MWRVSRAVNVPVNNVSRGSVSAVCRYSQETGKQQAGPSKARNGSMSAPPVMNNENKAGGGMGALGKVASVAAGAATVGGVAYALFDKDAKQKIDEIVPSIATLFPAQQQPQPKTLAWGFGSCKTTERIVPPTFCPEECGTEREKAEIREKECQLRELEEKQRQAEERVQCERREVECASEKLRREKEALQRQLDEKKRCAEEKLRREREEIKACQERVRGEKEMVTRRLKEKEKDIAQKNQALENALRKTIKETTPKINCAINDQLKATNATIALTQKLKDAVEDPDLCTKEAQWESCTRQYEEKIRLKQEAEKSFEAARCSIEKLKSIIDQGKENCDTDRNPVLLDAEKLLNKLAYDLATAEQEHKRADCAAKLMNEFQSLVERGKCQFKKELACVKPDCRPSCDSDGKMTEEELNILIAHAHTRVEQLQMQLSQYEIKERQRLQQAMDKQQDLDEKCFKERLEIEKKKMTQDFKSEKCKWEADQRVLFEAELTQQLSRQAAAHSDHLSQVLSLQERELKASFDAELTQKLYTERLNFQLEVAGWIARIKGLEQGIDERAELEREGKKAQQLWLACQSLLNATDDNGSHECLRPLECELQAVRCAGSNSLFVNALVDTFPITAMKRGVIPSEGLRSRFPFVEKACKRVAMIDEQGGSLFKYVLSYFQSMFVFKNSKIIEDHEEINVCDLDTFVILDNAAASIEKCDLEQAVRFMNQLKGEPRRLAKDWIYEARLYLETKQAAEALLAYAQAKGIGSLV